MATMPVDVLYPADPCAPAYAWGYEAGWCGAPCRPPMGRGAQAEHDYMAGYNNGLIQRGVNPVQRRRARIT